jgi:drug/metabolite transporter (DMT)-like permease
LIVLFGGVLGPALLMAGLTSASGGAGSLLLNTESLATMAIAWIFFRKNADRRVFASAMAILAGALVLSWPVDGAGMTVGRGGALIVAACICWGIDNNLTRKLSAADPVQIAMVKGVAAGVINTALGFAHGAQLPEKGTLAAAAIVGFLGYGVSLALLVLGLRHLGMSTTCIIGTRMRLPIRKGDLIAIRTSMAVSSTSTRIIPICITGTSTLKSCRPFSRCSSPSVHRSAPSPKRF